MACTGLSLELLKVCSSGVVCFLLSFAQTQHWITHTISDLWPTPEETINLMYSMCSVTVSNGAIQLDTENGTSVLHRRTSLNKGSVFDPTKSAPERPMVYTRESPEKRRSNRRRRQRVVPFGRCLRFYLDTISKGRISDRSRLGRPFCSMYPGDLYY